MSNTSKTKKKTLKLQIWGLLFLLFFCFGLFNGVSAETNYIYSGSSDNTVRKINPDGEEVWSYDNNHAVYGLAVDSNGFVYTGDADKKVKKISPDGVAVWTFGGHNGIVSSVAVDNDGYIYSVSMHNCQTLKKISPEGEEIWNFNNFSTLTTVAVDNDGYIYTGDVSNNLKKISPDGNEVWTFTGHTGSVADIAVDSDGNIYSASIDNTVRKINPDGEEVWSFDGHNNNVRSIAIDSDGYIYSGSDNNTVRKINPDGNEVWTFTGHTENVNGVAVDNDGYIYSGSSDKKLKKISPDGNEVWSFDDHINSVIVVTVYTGLEEPEEMPEGAEPIIIINSPHIIADTFVYLKSQIYFSAGKFARFMYRETGASEWEFEQWQQIGMNSQAIVKKLPSWSINDPLTPNTEYEVKVQVVNALPTLINSGYFSPTIQFTTGDPGSGDEIVIDEPTIPTPPDEPEAPEPPENWYDVGGWYQFLADYMKYIYERFTDYLSYLVNITIYNIGTRTSEAIETASFRVTNTLTNFLNSFKNIVPFNWIFEIQGYFEIAKEAGGNTEYPSFTMNILDTDIEMLPFETVATEEETSNIFPFIKTVLGYLLWLGLAFFIIRKVLSFVRSKSN